MDIEKLQEFFFWCMLVNTGIYALTACWFVTVKASGMLFVLSLFGLDEESVSKSVQRYLVNYKLLIIVFDFVPWIAILIIK